MLNFENFAKNVEMLKMLVKTLKHFDAKYIFFQRQSHIDNF